MPKLQEYTETLDFRLIEKPNISHRVLMPSELDLAIKRHLIATQDGQLDRLEEQPEPGDIVKARQALAKEGLEADAKVLLQAKISAYEARRVAEQEGWLQALWNTQRALEKAEAQVDGGLEEGVPQPVRYEMREFSQRERMEADEANTIIEEAEDETKRKVVAITERNLKLLDTCLLGEWVPEESGTEAPLPRKEFDGVPHVLVDAGSAEDLQQQVAQTLIERMWTRNTMSPELVGFFSKRGRPSRLTSP